MVRRNHAKLTFAVLFLAFSLLACGEQGEEAPPPSGHQAAETPGGAPETPVIPLANTEWRLVEIQSMDDGQGTTRPEDPSVFTMRLNEDGSVNLRLDCNRANGSWSAEMGPSGSGGTFEFGPLAGTRALCPPPNLDEQILGQAPYIRSFLLEDGMLYLSLMADGGIWAWEPLREISLENEPDPGMD